MLLEYFKATYELYEKPTFTQFKELILGEIDKEMRRKGRLSGRSGLWKETVMRIVKFLSAGSVGRVLTTNKHYPLEKLFSRPVILEFGALKNPRDRKFLIHLICNYLNFNLEYQGLSTEGQLRQVIIFEEFHNVALQTKEDNMISNLFRQGRKWGIGIIAIDQTPSLIPLDVYANMNVKISFALGTGQDIAAMAKAINLPFDKSHYLSMLNTGQALINVKQFFHEPFMIQVPFTDPGPNCTDAMLKKAFSTFSKDVHIICAPESPPNLSQAPQRNETSPLMTKIAAMEKVVLTDLATHPFDGVDKRTKRLGLHPAQMKQLNDKLISLHLIRPLLINSLKLFDFTKLGLETLKKEKISYSLNQGRGGLEHSYVIMKIDDHLKTLGFTTEKEKDNHDLVAFIKDEKIIFEIESGKSDITRNLLKLTNSQVSQRFMIATNKPAEIKIKKLATNFPTIHTLHFKQFLKLKQKNIISPS
jgi:hypothetical protein